MASEVRKTRLKFVLQRDAKLTGRTVADIAGEVTAVDVAQIKLVGQIGDIAFHLPLATDMRIGYA